MAEYYPLLAKAVAGLPTSTPETRRAIYDRARKALLGQLKGLDPPVAEADIEREVAALDAAAARVERELAGGGAVAAPAKSVILPKLKPFAPMVRAPGGTGGATTAPQDPPRVEAEGGAAPPVSTEPETDGALADDAATVRPPPQRPFAPQPPYPVQGGHRYLWLVAVVVGVVVVGVAIAAWKLRDRPEDIARAKPAPAQSDAGSKIVDRIGGAPAANEGATTPASQAPAAKQAADTAASTADTANPPVPVAYRAALLVEAPDEPNKVKTYVGTVIWHLDTVSGANQPVSTAVRADIDVPEAKLQGRLVLQKNFDATLPASHTLKITFTIDQSGPLSSVKQISVPQIRKEGSPTGEALSGVPVPIMENSFLVGLSPGSFEAGNLASLQNNQWIDVPMLLTNGRIAKLTFEKGPTGQRAIDDAIASWQGQ
jgi:hypothetical protein